MAQATTQQISQIEELVRAAGDKLLELWPATLGGGRELKIDRKADGTMVTEADLASHEIVTTGLKKLFPDDFILSEEDAHPEEFEAAETAWILDPLDGTEAFSKGENFFAVFLARREGKITTEAMMYYPARGHFYYAGRGRGATLNGAPLKVSPDSTLRSGSIFVEGIRLAPHPHLCGLKEHPVATSAFGALCKGELDGVIVRFNGGSFYPWDFAPGLLVIEESGGRVTDDAGRTVSMTTCPVQCRYLIASNGKLHDKVMEMIPK